MDLNQMVNEDEINKRMHENMLPEVIGSTAERLYQWILLTPIEQLQEKGRDHILEQILLMIMDLEPLTPGDFNKIKESQKELESLVIDLQSLTKEAEKKVNVFLEEHKSDTSLAIRQRLEDPYEGITRDQSDSSDNTPVMPAENKEFYNGKTQG